MYCRFRIARSLHFQPVAMILLSAGLVFLHFLPAMAASSRAERRVFQRSIIDKRKQLHPSFKKVLRKRTKYIVVHTSEAGLNVTLKVVSRGKLVRGRRLSYGGHAHYVIARDGRCFRILNKKYVADHAGLSMWNGETDISRVSIGIELAGYHYTKITNEQYRSVGVLIDILQKVYSLGDKEVLTHSQVAYGNSNFWFKKKHRGRKRCAMNFDRARAGLGPTWSFDPDVKARRLVADPELASIFYGRRVRIASAVEANVITARNSAWTIAGEDYDSPTTLYQFPNGRVVPGDKIKAKVGWKHIPRNTVVLLNQMTDPYDIGNRGPVKTISNGLTAWTFAGPKYKKRTTFYIFPKGQIKNGTQISDWDELPSQTKMIVGYHGPHKVTRSRLPIEIAGTNYKGRETLYYFPKRRLLTGNKIKDFKRLPPGVLMFVPVKRS